MESRLPTDILYSIIAEVAGERQSAHDLRSVSLASRLLREVTLPVLFANVQWPHGDKHSEENGLEFFPETLWRHFRKLSLLWPDHWPDASPPMWGDRYYIGGDYHPRHLDKLVRALPRMEGLSKFHISCPFYPPVSIFAALVQCPSIRSLSISDTPLYIDMLPRIPSQFNLEHISLVPVAEALRVGEGPYDSKYQEVTYYIRDYRKKYRNDSLARYAADSFLFNLGKADSLRSVQVSGDLCSLSELAQYEWPNLHTLILTGHAPRANPSGTELVDVIAQMPKLVDLRLLFATVKNDPLFRILPTNVGGEGSALLSSSYAIVNGPSGPYYTLRRNPATLLSQIRYLAMSNACQLSGIIFHYANQLERLVICAISDLPRVPVALSRAEINALMRELGTPSSSGPASNGDAPNPSSSSNSTTNSPSPSYNAPPTSTSSSGTGNSHYTIQYPSLKLLRIMIEDKANPELCHQISSLFPNLETLEVELCGYHDGKPIYDWDEFAVAFTPLTHLKNLRMCIQFPEFDDADRVEPWRNARRECASLFASRLPTLECVGFEYRKRTGTHRYEDSWLEYGVERYGDESGSVPNRSSGRPAVRRLNSASSLNSRVYVPAYHHPQGIHVPPGFVGPCPGGGGRVGPVPANGVGGSTVLGLEELPRSWYRFPEVWSPEYLTD